MTKVVAVTNENCPIGMWRSIKDAGNFLGIQNLPYRLNRENYIYLPARDFHLMTVTTYYELGGQTADLDKLNVHQSYWDSLPNS